MDIKFLTTGGTFDKIYYDAKSDFHIGEPMATILLEEANAGFNYDIQSILKKDSLDMTEQDREYIRQQVSCQTADKIIIIHGTDTMIATAMQLLEIADKTIVITGAMQPARMRCSDASYNIGFACSAVQLLPAGVYIAMHGQIFDPRKSRKNIKQSRFEPIE